MSVDPRNYPPPPAPPRRSWFGSCLSAFFLMGTCVVVPVVVFLLLGLAGLFLEGDSLLMEEHHSLTEGGEDKIAIITVDGAILDGDGFVKRQIDAVRDDEAVKAVVLRVDSPGGTVTGSDYIYHHLCKLRDERKIPVVVSMGGMCASGGYYVAMAVGDKENVIFAEPTTWTGSIGVIIPHYNVAGLMKDWEIEEDSVASHRLKGMGSLTKKMTEEEKGIFQGLVDDSFVRFKDIVKAGRPRYKQKPEELDAIATGQVFTTNQAIANGLVDKEGFIEAAIDRALELAALDKNETDAVKYEEPLGFGDLLMASGNVRGASSGIDLKQLLNLTSPRAYYLCTFLPGAL